MGRKHISRFYPVSEGADMSAQIITESTVVEQYDTVSYFIDWSGLGVSGEFFVEVSIEEEIHDATWQVLDFGTSIGATLDTGSDQILLTDIHFKRIRLRYEPTAGTGAMDVRIKSTTKGA